MLNQLIAAKYNRASVRLLSKTATDYDLDVIAAGMAFFAPQLAPKDWLRQFFVTTCIQTREDVLELVSALKNTSDAEQLNTWLKENDAAKTY